MKTLPTNNVSRFLEAARKYGDFLKNADSKNANKQQSLMTKLANSIIQEESKEEVLNHLHDDEPYVRLCVASFFIKQAPDECLMILQTLQNSSGPVSLSAGIIIDLWNTKRL